MKQLNNQEKALLTQQLAMILESGLTLSDALIEVGIEAENKEYGDKLKAIGASLQSGMSLSQSFEESGIMDEYMVDMIAVGESSGYLDKVMHQLTLYYQRMHQTNLKLKDALTYPSILIIMTLGVVALLIGKVLPIFDGIMASIGVSLPPLAQSLLSFSRSLSKYGIILVVLVIIAIGYLIYHGKKHGLMSRKISGEIELAQIAFALSLYIQSGYSVEDALESLMPTIHNGNLKSKVECVWNDLRNGIPFEQSIVNCQLFKSIYNRMISIGFKTGKGDETLAQVATYYEDEVDNSVVKMLDIIEPTLVAILAIVVGIILLSIMLPLINILASL